MSDELLYRRFYGRGATSRRRKPSFSQHQLRQSGRPGCARGVEWQAVHCRRWTLCVIQPGRAEVAFAVVDEYRDRAQGLPLCAAICASSRFERTDRRSLGQQRRHPQSVRAERPPHEHEPRGPHSSRPAGVCIAVHHAFSTVPRSVGLTIRLDTSSSWWQKPDRR